jgi:hypothetical protein
MVMGLLGGLPQASRCSQEQRLVNILLFFSFSRHISSVVLKFLLYRRFYVVETSVKVLWKYV